MGYDNNIYTNTAQKITFASKLADGAKIGIVAHTDGMILTDGFTTAGHVQADVAKYFASDIRGLTLGYESNEVVVTYDLVLAWNETVQASVDNSSDELFVLFNNWTAASGSFGAGVGFDNGMLLVPTNASVVIDLLGKTIDMGNAASKGVFIVNGKLEIATNGTIKGGNAENGGGVLVDGGHLIMKAGSISSNTASYGGGV